MFIPGPHLPDHPGAPGVDAVERDARVLHGTRVSGECMVTPRSLGAERGPLGAVMDVAPAYPIRIEPDSIMDKKALKEQYKNTPKPIGIWRVYNKVDDLSFIGTSANVDAAINGQLARLKFGGHPNTRLQSDWNRLGPDAFAFEVLDTIAPPERPDYDPKDDLRALEELWLEKLSPYDERGYNVRPKR